MVTQAFRQARFITSSAKLSQLPPDTGIEVAFAGRSNAGKSTALNTITDQRKLAHTSKTPGRTQLINLFAIAQDKHFVDLPGYGYAKVAITIKERWQKTLAKYLETRQCLRGMVLVMDIRHPLKEMDIMMLAWADAAGLPVHILLTKSDKLSKSQAMQTMLQVKKSVNVYPNTTVQCFSSLKREGIDTIHQVLLDWFDITEE